MERDLTVGSGWVAFASGWRNVESKNTKRNIPTHQTFVSALFFGVVTKFASHENSPSRLVHVNISNKTLSEYVNQKLSKSA
jgi:hypothetical protein